VVEAVGIQESFMQAVGATRGGGHLGYIGVNDDVTIPGLQLFFAGIHTLGGPAPVRRFLADLIQMIWDRKIDSGRVFDLTFLRSRPPRATGRWTSDERPKSYSLSDRTYP
jgi:threonine dehydrogenase-like Zn-dependent dehydrogenase